MSNKTDIGAIAAEYAGGRTVEQLRESMNRSATKREHTANTAAATAYIQSLPERKAAGTYVLPTVQEMEYTEARRAFGAMLLQREAVLKVLKGNDDFKVVFDESQKAVVSDLLKWVINDQTSRIPLQKGIWLWGAPGTFKTELTKLLSAFSLSQKLTKAFEFVDWSVEFEKLVNDKIQIVKPNVSGNRAFDEFLKYSTELKSYGNVENPTEALISQRYTRFIGYGWKTIIVTNAHPNEAEKMLSPQAFDRICQMCQSVEMPGKSKRRDK